MIHRCVQEIVLSDITQVKSNNFETPVSVSSSSLRGPSNYVFEIHLGETIYYIGENPSVGTPADMYSNRGIVCSIRSGSGLEQAQSWETAVRQARLPLMTRPSVNEQSSSALTVVSHQPSSELHCFHNSQYDLQLFGKLIWTKL